MNLQQFIEGYVIGFSVGTTIGISGILCIQNMMTGQISLGLASVLGTALADMSCGALVLFGLKSIELFLIQYKTMLGIFAGLLLSFLGLRKLFGKVEMAVHHSPSGHIFAAFGSVYFLSCIDPVSILDFMTLCLGLAIDFSEVSKVYQFILGIFFGSLSWWLLVYALVLFLKKSITAKLFQIMQYLLGSGILFLGLWTLWSVLNFAK
jgi:threonine/homoserine/homoserine lactone efflux protein